jgi:hypothetical protein
VPQALSLDCACAPILTGTAAAFLRSPRRFREPLKRADSPGVSDLSQPTLITCALRRRHETNLVAQAQSRHPPHAATRLFRSRTFHPTARAKGRTEL